LRRNWIKLYVGQILTGTMMDELKNEERWSWIGLLLLAGDSKVEGCVCVTAKMGYTDEQICELLDVPLDIFKKAKSKMVKCEKIKVLDNNVIKIVNWNKYQSEYKRQRKYRESYNQKLQPKVTTKSNTLEERKKKEEYKNNRKKKKIKKKKEENQISLFEKAFNDFWDAYPKKVAKDYAKEKFMILMRKGELESLMDAFNGYMNFLKARKVYDGFNQEPLNPATFLSKNRWKDYIGFNYKPPL